MYGAAWGPGGAVAWGPGGWARTTGNVYHRYGNTGAVTRTSGGFNAWTGNRWASQVGTSYNSRNGNIAAGQRGAVYNVYSGNYAYGGRGAITSGRTGNTITGGRLTVGDAGSGQSGNIGYVRGEGGGTIARVGDDIYAGRDGNVYRKGENGWEQRTDGGWNSVDRPTPTGETRAQTQPSRPSSGQSPQVQPRPPRGPAVSRSSPWIARALPGPWATLGRCPTGVSLEAE